jgi:hypothetical protein
MLKINMRKGCYKPKGKREDNKSANPLYTIIHPSSDPATLSQYLQHCIRVFLLASILYITRPMIVDLWPIHPEIQLIREIEVMLCHSSRMPTVTMFIPLHSEAVHHLEYSTWLALYS